MRPAWFRRSSRLVVALMGAILVFGLLPVAAHAVDASVFGTVYKGDGSGEPIAGALVSVEDEFGTVLNLDVTDGAGAFSVGGIGQFTGITVRAKDPLGMFVADGDSYAGVTLTEGIANGPFDFYLGEAGRAAGRVLDDLGSPLESVAVFALTENLLGEEEVLFSTVTAADGTYTLGGVWPGQYRILFQDQGAPPLHASEYHDDELYFYDADYVQFTTGTPTPVGDAELASFGFITGRVTDASATPIPVSWVEAYRLVPQPGGDQWVWTSVAYTDATGDYTLSVLPGTYRIKAGEDNALYVQTYYAGSTDINAAQDIVVSAMTTETGKDFSLAAAGHITGTVSVRGGSALAAESVWVEAFRRLENGDLKSVTVGDHPAQANSATGVFDVPVNYEGDVYLRFTSSVYSNVYYPGVPYSEDATTVAAVLGGTVSGVDQVVDPKGSVAGRVTSSTGAGLSNVIVEVYDARTGSAVGEQSVTSDVSGYYTIPGLDIGEYKLRFWDDARRVVPEWYDNATKEASATPVVLTWDALNKTGVNAMLSPAGRISGTITSKSTGKPIAGIAVTAYDIDPNDGWREFAGATYTDSNGDYSLLGPFTGYAKVWTGDDSRYVSRWYSDKPDEEQATLIPTTAGSTVYGIDIALANGASIAGTLKDGSAQPVDGAVTAYKKVGDELQYVGDYNAGTGSYKASSLDAGSYVLRFRGDGVVPEYYDNAKSVQAASAVALTTGQARTGVNAVMGQGGTIGGAITGVALSPHAEAIDVSTGYMYSGWVTDDATYTIEMLPPGQYKVVFYDDPEIGNPAVAPEFYNDAAEFSQAETLTVTEGGVIANVDAALLGDSNSISGHFVSGADDVPGWVSVARADVDTLVADYYWRNTRTDADGRFQISNLTSGDYRLYFYPDSPAYCSYYYPGVVLPSLMDTFTVVGSYEATLGVQEKVTLDTSIQGVGGAGIGPRRASVRLWYDAGADGWLNVMSGYASGVQGASNFDSLFPGKYKVEVVDAFGGYRNTFFGGSSLASATSVTLGPGILGGIAPPPEEVGPVVIPLTHLGTAKTRVTLAANTKAPAYGYSSTLVGQVSDVNGWPFPGKTVKVYSASKSTGPWTLRKTLTTGSNGRTSGYAVKPSVLTYYRLVYTGPDSVSKTATIAVKPKAYVTLFAPSGAKRNTAFTFWGSLKPRHTAGSTVVRLYAYRYVNGSWKYTKYAYGKAYNYSSYSRYSGKVSLPYAGKWKLVAVHSDTGHTSTSSTTLYVTVK